MRLTLGQITLRALKQSDAERLAELGNNEHVFRNVRDAFPHPYTTAAAEKFIQMCNEQVPQRVFAIEYNNELAGCIALTPGEDVYRRSAEIGYFVGEPYWNKGIATTAIKLITDHAFKHRDIVRIYAGVFEFNTASQRVLEKCGFEREGVFKKSVVKMDQLWSEIRYAKINPEIDNL